MACLRRAPHLHIVRPVGNENVAGFFTGNQGGRRPAYIAWFDAISLSRSKVYLDFNLWYLLMEFHMQINQALNPLEGSPHLTRFFLEEVQLVAIDAHDNGFGGSGQHLPDSLFQIGQHVAKDAGVAVNRRLNFMYCLVIVDRRIDADPILAEMHTDHFIHDQGLSDVGTEVAYPRNGSQLLAGLNCDPVHLRP